MNSLKEESNNIITKLNEIRLSIKYPQNKDKVFILLEGETDIRLFRKLFSNDLTDIFPLGGKDKVIEVLGTLHNESYMQVIGIKDADFEHIEDIPRIDSLFITDYHDMEIEMTESNALKSIIDEFSSSKCYDLLLKNLKNYIYDISLEIGYVRWYNERVQAGIKFEGLDFTSFTAVNKCKITFDEDGFLTSLWEHANNLSLKVSKKKLDIEINKLKKLSKNKLQISNGHDVTKLISMLFSKTHNSNKGNLNKEKIEESLRLSYHIDYFKKTTLYKNLDCWASNNSYKLFF